MNNRIKWLVVAGVSVVALVATAAVGVTAWQQYQDRQDAPSAAETAAPGEWADGDRVVFRNTALGEGYGLVASVPLADPSGARALTDIACDRVDATPDEFSCLRTERGVVPSYSASLYSNNGIVQQTWPLPGIPSRTRISDDGTRISTTSFVTGHSYATIGFSTETVIHDDTGGDFGNFEEWTFVVDGAPSAPVDRNFWGVTFIDDDTFYATAGMTNSGKTYLVKGDTPSRTLTTIAEDVECPSLSPDGTRIAFKSVTAGAGPTVHWTPAVMDLATGEVELLPESRNVDDQIEWLGDDTILYGMPREGQAGDYDVWALSADGSGDPEILIEHAWSPSVVRR
ncbi:TolB family protein [Microbacterium sp. NPDC056044]|uniref:TolB family protein n=1 Tax=Microbacterium sp. NPDC056044 TaxID=3345690 RepID=UPI0035D9F5EB